VTSIGEQLELMDKREMLVVPNTSVTIECPALSTVPLLLLSVYPFKSAVEIRKGIVCAGLSCVDYVIKKCGVIQSSTDHVRAESYEKRCGGSVYNTAKALSILGRTRIEALTLIGIDDDGQYILNSLNKLNVGK
jgi:hypothetical protein